MFKTIAAQPPAGPSSSPQSSLSAYLAPLGLKLRQVPDNGDCAFEAVAFGFNALALPTQTGSIRHSVASLREDCRIFAVAINRKLERKVPEPLTRNQDQFLSQLY